MASPLSLADTLFQVFPVSLQNLKRLGTDLSEYAAGTEGEQWKCHGCDMIKPSSQLSRCGKCKLFCYCSKVRSTPAGPHVDSRATLDTDTACVLELPSQGLEREEPQGTLQGGSGSQLYGVDEAQLLSL